MSEEAEKIINLYKAELTKASVYRSHCQDVAEYMFPREGNITTTRLPGSKVMNQIYDPTAILALNIAVSGLMYYLVPTDQPFFALKASLRELNELEIVKRYLSIATEIVHAEIFQSNFLIQFTETLKSLLCFGTGNIWSGYSDGLNFIDYDIGKYLILENSKREVDTVFIWDTMSARQAQQEWGDNVSKSIKEALADDKKENENFEFLWSCRPNKGRNPFLEDNLNMPFEVKVIAVKDKEIIYKGGSNELQYHVGRWTKSSGEVWGRGQGMFILPSAKSLNTVSRDFEELVNRINNPATEVLDTFEGTIDLTPRAQNMVSQIPTIKAIESNVRGDYPTVKDYLEIRQGDVRKAFYQDVFDQLAELKGDRRTQLEIRERLREGFQKIGPPIYRIYRELFNPIISRVLLLLIRNGKVPLPPEQLQGRGFKIEYVSELAMALKSQQIRGVRQWISDVAEMEAVFPGVKDNIDSDEAVRDMGMTYAVKPEHIRPIEKVEEIRKIRQAELERKEALEAAQVAANAYAQTGKAPEDGSAAQQLQEAVS